MGHTFPMTVKYRIVKNWRYKKVKESIVYYRSFYESLRNLPLEVRAEVQEAIFQYSFEGTIPELSVYAEAIFTLIKPQLDANDQRYINSKKGGAPRGNKNAEKAPAPQKEGAKQPDENKQPMVDLQNNSKQPMVNFENNQKQPNVNDNVNVNEKSFELFWKAYPKKVNKASAMKTWNKLEPDDDLVRLILSALEQFKQTEQWQKEDGQYIPYPSTWLNNKRWEDNLFCDTTSQKEYSFDLNDYKSLVNNFGEE